MQNGIYKSYTYFFENLTIAFDSQQIDRIGPRIDTWGTPQLIIVTL